MSKYWNKQFLRYCSEYTPWDLESRVSELKWDKLLYLSVINIIGDKIKSMSEIHSIFTEKLTNDFLIIYYNHLTGENRHWKDAANRIEYAVYKVYEEKWMDWVNAIVNDILEFWNTIDLNKEQQKLEWIRIDANPQVYEKNDTKEVKEQAKEVKFMIKLWKFELILNY